MASFLTAVGVWPVPVRLPSAQDFVKILSEERLQLREF